MGKLQNQALPRAYDSGYPPSPCLDPGGGKDSQPQQRGRQPTRAIANRPQDAAGSSAGGPPQAGPSTWHGANADGHSDAPLRSIHEASLPVEQQMFHQGVPTCPSAQFAYPDAAAIQGNHPIVESLKLLGVDLPFFVNTTAGLQGKSERVHVKW